MSPAKKKPASKKPVRKTVRKPVVKTARRATAKPAASKARGRSVTPAKPPAQSVPVPPPHVVAAVRALDEKKAEAIRVLRLGQLSSVADWLVVATGNSEPHLRALRIELERSLDETGSPARGIESHKDSGWTVVDAFDVIFHLFREDVRRDYALESLWKDGFDVPVAALLKV